MLARVPGAPPGTKGISLFIVPKFLVNDDGSLGERNDLRVLSSEDKIGIHASPTCVMSYGDEDGAVGYLIGEENTGMRAMFTMMNNARLSVGLEGLALSDRSYQLAKTYALDRHQGKALNSEVAAGESSPIVDHVDVRRMLLTMRSNIEAMRCLMYANAAAIDFSKVVVDDEEKNSWDSLAALLTPVSKGWGTDVGVEMTSLGIQVHGGMGYVEETGAAQHWRDIRIAPIYEGTNGIQAADLVFRKLPMSGGAVVKEFVEEMTALADELIADQTLQQIGLNLRTGIAQFVDGAQWLGERISSSPNDAAAGSAPFLRLTGIVFGGYYLAKSAQVAQKKINTGTEDIAFYKDKITVAEFYAEQVLPTATGLLPLVKKDSELFYAIASDRL